MSSSELPAEPAQDLASARALSQRLAEDDEPPGSVAGTALPDPAAFVRLRPAPRPAPLPAAARPVPSMPAPPPGLPADELWGPLLDWCRAAARAESAFLVGPEGLLMETRGALALDDAQRLGTQLRGALEKARRMVPEEGDPHVSIVVETAGFTLTGFSPALRDGKVLTIGFAGKEPVPGPLRDEVFRGFSLL